VAIIKTIVFWEIPQSSLIKVYRRFESACCLHYYGLLMQAASISETSVNLYLTTQRSFSEDSHLLQKVCPTTTLGQMGCLVRRKTATHSHTRSDVNGSTSPSSMTLLREEHLFISVIILRLNNSTNSLPADRDNDAKYEEQIRTG
jgi:hypothetical protein